METKSWPLIVMCVLSLTVMAGSVAWAEATHAQPHAGAKTAEAAAPTISGAGFSICATGNYSAYVVLTQTKAKSPTAAPGKCVTEKVSSATAEYKIQVFGLDGTTAFEIGDDEIGGDGTETVTVKGTADNPDWSTN